MDYLSPHYFPNSYNDDLEYEDDQNEDFYENNFDEGENDSEEDTDEASECEMRTFDKPVEMKEQMYQDKLASLKRQLEELKQGSHPEYLRRVRKLEHQFKERLRVNEIYRDYLVECVERDYILEKKAAAKEFEEKKADLKENLLTDFEDRRKMIETERHSMELTSDSMDVKPTVTRKLRRRPNEPIPVVEKRRKPANGQLVLLLDEKDVENDLKLISRCKGPSQRPPPSMVSNNGLQMLSGSPTNSGGGGNPLSSMGGIAHLMEQQSNHPLIETKIEDGKLWYERRWFHRGQSVFVEGKDFARFSATISSIGNDVVCVKKLNDNGSKIKINTAQLSRGKISIKRRAS